jgi:hypothetical protein
MFEETHNKLRRLISALGNSQRGQMEIERPAGDVGPTEFLSHDFIKKYSQLVKFSGDMAKLTEEFRDEYLKKKVDASENLEEYQKQFTALWNLLNSIFSYMIR